METKIIQKHVLIPSTKDATVYVSNDGKEFDNEKDCLNHEEWLITKYNGEKTFTKPDIDEETLETIIRLALDGYSSISDAKIFLFTHTKDERKIQEFINFLRGSKYINVHHKDIIQCNDGELYAAISWTQDYDSDYPSYYTKFISVEKINKSFELISNTVKEKLQIIK